MGQATTRRRFLQGSLAALAGGIGGTCLPGRTPAGMKRSSGPADRPNVLFITIDDLNHSIGCYGDEVVHTPSIDRLAAMGMRFDRAYCQFPVCNPSRTSFLTGLRPDTTGVVDNRVAFRSRLPDVVTMPQLFRRAGYFTARLGKIFHGSGEKGDPTAWDSGFDARPTEIGRRGEGRNLTDGRVKWCRWMAAEGGDEDQPDGQFATEAIRLLQQRRDEPFFIGLGFHKPHDPFVAPKKYFDLYPLEELEPPKEPADASPLNRYTIGSGWKESFDKFTIREQRQFRRAYYAGASFVDAQIGRVLDAMQRLDLMDNTIIVFLADHGYQLGDHGWWNKNTLYEQSTRAPLIVAVPGATEPGTSCKRFVEFVDIYPTLAQLCGLKIPHAVEGRSFVPLLRDPHLQWKQAAYTQVQRGQIAGRAVRTARWRYIEWDEGRQGVELYDHQNDPGEFYNLGSDPAHADVRKRLRRLLREPAGKWR